MVIKHTYHNPLIPDHYPGPSIYRIGGGYYLVRSASGFLLELPTIRRWFY